MKIRELNDIKKKKCTDISVALLTMIPYPLYMYNATVLKVCTIWGARYNGVIILVIFPFLRSWENLSNILSHPISNISVIRC